AAARDAVDDTQHAAHIVILSPVDDEPPAIEESVATEQDFLARRQIHVARQWAEIRIADVVGHDVDESLPRQSLEREVAVHDDRSIVHEHRVAERDVAPRLRAAGGISAKEPGPAYDDGKLGSAPFGLSKMVGASYKLDRLRRPVLRVVER